MILASFSSVTRPAKMGAESDVPPTGYVEPSYTITPFSPIAETSGYPRATPESLYVPAGYLGAYLEIQFLTALAW